MPKKRVDPIIESVTLEPELEEALASATDAELCDIAGDAAAVVDNRRCLNEPGCGAEPHSSLFCGPQRPPQPLVHLLLPWFYSSPFPPALPPFPSSSILSVHPSPPPPRVPVHCISLVWNDDLLLCLCLYAFGKSIFGVPALKIPVSPHLYDVTARRIHPSNLSLNVFVPAYCSRTLNLSGKRF